MDDQTFVAGVLRTESPVDNPAVQARFKNSEVIKELYTAINNMVGYSKDLDALKKFCFYGKLSPDLWFSAQAHEVAPSIQKALTPQVIRLIHAAMGLATEAGEILEHLRDHVFDEKPLDTVNLVEEGGDTMWYMGLYSDALKTKLEEIKRINNAKLKSRYPDKFTEEKAIERNLDQERQVLESKNS